MLMERLIFSFITTLSLTFVIIPSLIKIAKEKNLYDNPNERTSHKGLVPRLGGLAFYVALVFSISFWFNFSDYPQMQYIIAAMTVTTFVGLKDDLIGLSAFHKLMGQLFAAMVIVIWGGIRITSLYGIFGINELPEIISVIFTIFTVLVIVNSFNLIDGINGLSGSIALIASLTFGVWFYLLDPNAPMVFLAFSLVGVLTAFLRFNLSPAQIFMGDTGSLLLGIIISVLAIQFIEMNGNIDTQYAMHSGPAIAMGVLIYPLFDLLRSFSIRIAKGNSPLKADRNHIHHLLLDNGLSHDASTSIIILFNILIITIVFVLDNLGIYILGAIIIALALTFVFLLKLFIKRRKKKSTTL